jgi:hypothetical protein
MKATCGFVFPECRVSRLRKWVCTLEWVLFLLIPVAVLADIPDSPRSGGIPCLEGIYKIVSSTDPILPATGRQEIFLDFGRGIQAGRFSGSVAISLRQNPHVKVRIMAWQYFPQHGKLVLGNPCFEGARDAVVRGVWRIRGASGGVIMERDDCLVVLHRADPRDL